MRGIEILAILPATLLLIPLGASAAIGLTFALVQDFAAGFGGVALAPIVGLWIALVVPIIALVALWGAIAMSWLARPVDRSVRIATRLSLVFGLVSTGYWLWALSRYAGSILSFAVWIGLLGGPVVIGIRYLIWLGLKTDRQERQER